MRDEVPNPNSSARGAQPPSSVRRFSLSPKATIAASAGALLVWSIALLGVLQVGYWLNTSTLTEHSLAVSLVALVGFATTLLLILSRSRLEAASRLVLVAAAMSAFLCLVIWGGLSVACANGNCL